MGGFTWMIKDNTNITDKIGIKMGKGLQETISINGYCSIKLFNPQGKLKDKREIHNTITTAGKNGVADQILASPSLDKPTHMGIGEGSPSGTALGSEIDRNALTSKTRSGNIITYVGDWAAGDGTGAITESGIFDAVSSGNMWQSASFAVITKAAGDTLQITWTLTVG